MRKSYGRISENVNCKHLLSVKCCKLNNTLLMYDKTVTVTTLFTKDGESVKVKLSCHVFWISIQFTHVSHSS